MGDQNKKGKRVRWKIGRGKELLFAWSRGAAFDLSKEGFQEFEFSEAFTTTLLWACCLNRGKSTPRQFAELLPEGSDEGTEVFLELLRNSPFEAIAEELEKALNEQDAEEAFGDDDEEDELGKQPDHSPPQETILPNGEDSAPDAE